MSSIFSMMAAPLRRRIGLFVIFTALVGGGAVIEAVLIGQSTRFNVKGTYLKENAISGKEMRTYMQPGLRLRGGGLFNCFGCFCSDDPRKAATGETSVDADGKPVKKRKVGRVVRGPVVLNAPIQKVYAVITDFDHYTDWSGDGIKYMTYVQKTPKFCEINYTTGVFGIFFHFGLYWAMHPYERIIFRTTKPSRLLQFMRGEYSLKKVGPKQTEVSFVITADILAPIPDFLKYAIANLICDIAIFWLKRYVESSKCDENLRKYRLWPPAGMGAWRDRMTQLMTNAGTRATMGAIEGIMNFPPIFLARSLMRRSLRLLRQTLKTGINLIVQVVVLSLRKSKQVISAVTTKGSETPEELTTRTETRPTA